MEENNNEKTEPIVESTEPATEATKEEPVTEAAESTKEETKNNENKEKKKKPVATIILIIIALLALITLAIFYFRPNKDTNDTNDKNDETSGTTIETQNDIKSEYRMSGNSIEKFDLAFLKLENLEENKIYSPLSIKYALEMLGEGAKGESKEQIDAVIGDYKARKYENSDNMSFANAMFIRDKFDDAVKEEYKAKLRDKYGAEVILDPFTSPNTINNWVNDKTLKLIPKLVDDVENKDFYLINALGINMNWKYLIHCASGQNKNVPCYKGENNDAGMSSYYVTYNHEKLEGEDYEYERVSYPYTGDYDFPAIKFNGKENIKGVTVLASFNKYDAVKTIGEDKIREEVGSAYTEYLNTVKNLDDEEKDVNKYLDKYIKELNENYGKAENSTDFMLYDDDNVKSFAKDLQTYNGVTLQYVGIMPKNEKLSEFINKIEVKDLNNIINNLKDMKIENFKEGFATIIEGDIPLFKYEYELKLMNDLQKLGITDIFDPSKANFSGMLKDGQGGESIVEAKHKANIEFSNEGIKAAAATSEGGMGGINAGFNYLYEVPTIRINLTFDNPYLYLIRDKATGEVWFIGTVYDPIKK